MLFHFWQIWLVIIFLHTLTFSIKVDFRTIFTIHLQEVCVYILVVLLCYYRKLFNKFYIFHNQFVNILAFILENGKFSKEEMDKFLTMTVEFSRYMQEGILIVKLFFDEYLYYNSGEHLLKLLDLLQWMTSISVTGNYEIVLTDIENIKKLN